GDLLLCVAAVAADQLVVQLFSLQMHDSVATTAFLAELQLEDPFIGSTCSFHTAKQDVVALWIAAGQDGQQIRWITLKSGLAMFDATPLKNTTPPVFSNDGQKFLVVDEHSRLCKWSFPSVKEIGSCLWTQAEAPFSGYVSFLDE